MNSSAHTRPIRQYAWYRKHLLQWYGRNARDLPWREGSDPYHIWISEIMLQQTTVQTVKPYYKKWIKKYPTLKKLAGANIDEILNDWQGLGYYNRARNLHKTAAILCRQHDGKLPDTYPELLKLPGFGPYTAGAVASIAFGRSIPIIDANVRRVMMRILAVVNEETAEPILKTALEKTIPKQNPGDFNQALMELGALVCRSGSPQCLVCPLKGGCAAYRQGKQEIIPKPKNRQLRDIAVSCAVIFKGEKVFMQKRPPKGLLAGLWEFPGGKIEKGETAREALYREIFEEIHCRINYAKKLISVVHFYTQFRVKLHAYVCTLADEPRIDTAHKWLSLDELAGHAMPSGSAKIVDHLFKTHKKDKVAI